MPKAPTNHDHIFLVAMSADACVWRRAWKLAQASSQRHVKRLGIVGVAIRLPEQQRVAVRLAKSQCHAGLEQFAAVVS